jgi:hypothetical protein
VSHGSLKGTIMRIRTGLCLLACCAALAACTADPHKGPNTSVTTPHIGRPAPPASVQAALSSEPFTPYAALGLSSNDGLAPGESSFALGGACMTAAGYPNVNDADIPFGIRLGGPASLSFAQPWGQWGYLGATEAQQYGFNVPPGSALTQLGINGPGLGGPPSLPQAEQSAAFKCGTIEQDFSDAAQKGPLAGIQALSTDITNDVLRDPAVKSATHDWTACMAKNGFTFHNPQDVFFTEARTMYDPGQTGGGIHISPGQQVSASAQRTQLAAAVTDSDCTQSTDLAGIYFAVQASYEQQLVNANQQALSTAVRQYRAAYRHELTKLSGLLRTTKAVPFGKPPKAKTGPARPASG